MNLAIPAPCTLAKRIDWTLVLSHDVYIDSINVILILLISSVLLKTGLSAGGSTKGKYFSSKDKRLWDRVSAFVTSFH